LHKTDGGDQNKQPTAGDNLIPDFNPMRAAAPKPASAVESLILKSTTPSRAEIVFW
jgi:hypothetical protein